MERLERRLRKRWLAGRGRMPEAEPLISRGLLLWAFLLLVPVAMVAATLSALLERSGPIRLRHWAEEAGGSLRKLFESPVRFGVFRYLLSLSSRGRCRSSSPRSSPRSSPASHRAHPMLWAFVVVLLLVAVAEVVNRTLVGQDPERALRALTRLYRAALWLLSPLVAAALAAHPRRGLRAPRGGGGRRRLRRGDRGLHRRRHPRGDPRARGGRVAVGDRRLRRHPGAQRDDAAHRHRLRAGRRHARHPGRPLRRVRPLARCRSSRTRSTTSSASCTSATCCAPCARRRRRPSATC